MIGMIIFVCGLTFGIVLGTLAGFVIGLSLDARKKGGARK